MMRRDGDPPALRGRVDPEIRRHPRRAVGTRAERQAILECEGSAQLTAA
jgi:hypothetical protein